MRKRLSFLAIALFLVAANTVVFAKEPLCVDCHTNIMDKPFVHEGVMAGCDMCHEVGHVRTPNPPELKMDVNQLCFQCHDPKMLLQGCFPVPGQTVCGHPISSHPVEGPRDPLYPEKKFTCVSCHNPHSADMPKVFRYNYKKGESPYGGSLCAVCHWDKMFGGPPPPRPPWNRSR